MLAAGIGQRLFGGDESQLPKSLLRFAGKTLLARHLEALKGLELDSLDLVVGYREGDIAAEIAALGANDFVRLVRNPDYRRGSLVSMWQGSATLKGGDDVLFMDADVLYHPALLERLVAASTADCLLIDRDYEPGDDPVLLCLRGGAPVEFRKQAQGDFEVVGEWPGFLKVSAATGRLLAQVLDRFVAAGRLADPYEEAIREVLLNAPSVRFAVEDITGLPWIEIDFPPDVARARDQILPRIETASADQTRNTYSRPASRSISGG